MGGDIRINYLLIIKIYNKMKAKSFKKFAFKEVLKDYEDKKKIEIAKTTDEARK